jgi:hypothetical protein
MKSDLVTVDLLDRTYLQGESWRVNDSAKQVLGRIAEVWQIDTGRVPGPRGRDRMRWASKITSLTELGQTLGHEIRLTPYGIDRKHKNKWRLVELRGLCAGRPARSNRCKSDAMKE